MISLYAKGLIAGEIQAHLKEIYCTSVSREMISKTTDEIVADMAAWQNRPSDAVCPVLLIDAITVKVRDSQVANRPVCVAISVDLAGKHDVLGLWLGSAAGEGAKQWAAMLGELRNRGLADALIVCRDGLRGLPESIRATWPEATVQTSAAPSDTAESWSEPGTRQINRLHADREQTPGYWALGAVSGASRSQRQRTARIFR